MTKRLFIAEKPSMGKAIAAELTGAPRSQRTHVTVGNDTVTWCFGHLLELAPPQTYDPKFEKWVLGDLPIIPPTWKMQISGDKKEQVNAIKALLKDCDEVVHAGDPGREGQMIVDELLQFLGNKKPVKRILLNALDKKSIQQALAKLVPNNNYQPLFMAGQARSHADWVMGMNLTRAYTVLGRQAGCSGVLSVGRVQTPTLAIVVKRDLDIDNFKSKDYWVPYGEFSVNGGSFKAKWTPSADFSAPWLDESNRIIEQKKAQDLIDKVLKKQGTISHFEEKPKSIEPPLPFSLSMMQTYANSKWGVTASDTLKICQDLYDAKLTSYPRTDCPYLPPNQFNDANEVLDAVKTNAPSLLNIISGSNTKHQSGAWNEKKLGEHHAIIPTRLADPATINKLSADHLNLYNAICKRYIAQFYPNCEANATSVDVLIEQETFHASGQRITNPGWKVVFGAEPMDEEDKNSDDNDSPFPPITLNEASTCIQTSLTASKTSPPARFNDGSIIYGMTHIYQLVDDPEAKKKLKDVKGIGTEATRSNIIETLIGRGFLKREKKSIVSTTLGRALIHAFPQKMVDPALTAMWENAFDSIAKSEDGPQSEIRYRTFMDKQNGWLKQLLSLAPTADFSKMPIDPKTVVNSLAGHGKQCDKCNVGKMMTRLIKKGQSAGKTFLGCSNYPACSNSEWP